MISLVVSITYKCINKRASETRERRYIANESKENIESRREDAAEVNFDHHRNNSSLNIDGRSVFQSNMEIRNR